MVDAKGIAIGVVLVIVTLTIIFSIVGSSGDEITGAADSVSDPNNCTESLDSTGTAMTYNITSDKCYNSTGDETFSPTKYDLPLAGLFSSNGVVLLVFMAAILIFVILIGISWFKGKTK